MTGASSNSARMGIDLNPPPRNPFINRFGSASMPNLQIHRVDLRSGYISDYLVSDMAKKKATLDSRPRETWLKNMAKLAWILPRISERNIEAGDYTAARDRAATAYAHLRQITKDRMEVAEGIIMIPDYGLFKDTHTFRLFFSMSIMDSTPIRVTSMEVTHTHMYIYTESFYICIPIHMTGDEVAEMERFLKVTENIDPLAGDFDAS